MAKVIDRIQACGPDGIGPKSTALGPSSSRLTPASWLLAGHHLQLFTDWLAKGGPCLSADDSGLREALDLYQATRAIRILCHEAHQPRRRVELVQQAACQPAVQRANDGLVLVNRVPIGAVAEPEGNASLRGLSLGSEAQGGEGPAHPLLGWT